MKKKELILEGLSCANCAVKIEEEIKKLEGANDVSINFVTKTLKVNVDDENKLKEIEKIVKEIEPDVKVYDKDKIQKSFQKKNELDDHENKFNKRDEISRLLYSLTIFIIAILVKEPFGLKLSLFIVSYIISGWKVLYRSFINIKKGLIFDENFLMSIATIGAFSIGQFAEAVGVMIFYEIGELLQALAVDNSRRSIKSLLEIRPDYANLLDDGRTYKVAPQEVSVGQLILVKPGERIPLDGVVIRGSTMVDTSALTGEPVPKTIKEGDEVLSGFVNLNGSITVKVEKEYSQSTYSKILEIVETTASKKARTEKIISKFARYYTPIVVFSAIALAILPPLVFGGPFKQWLYRALVFLVISCPCALVLSIPLGYFAGIGKLSKKGVLVKGGNYLETLKNLDTIIFDKTGTLTEGVFEVTEVKAYNGINNNELLKIAAYAESHSNHPIATSIKEYYNDNIDEKLIQEYQEIVGKGVRAKINGETVLVGNMDFMLENGVDIPTIEPNGTIVYVGINNIFAGYIKISDKIRPQTKDTINKLKELGIKKTVLLTGDNEETAKRVALELGVDEYYANLLPEDKVTLLERYLSDKPSVAFVGDGINDAPVLARSDVGIAMGGLGSDAAIEAADVVIMEDDISRIIDAINVSRKTINIIWQNIIFILAVKILFLILGALGLANMWGAVFADVGVSLLAVFNCMRILK
ncbi:heavy metal translocating P-type ATPase [Defluviitoga tunisiensis]|uniref:Cadmium, zinc and cobalt-transporting ATPase n=1 Tax=Defluviitoga tunisiensis TaxID=1006576 RepID=A0A0C7NQU9_DEFTU|nr:heavy metal translocating P-type ATPase [Defluviitoga tunisiensis]CEP78232.1 Cadmium, zinc and cobalt-transporting ATPase [Defluviitoga tunisiensis]